jgi:hypothetical protein
MPRQSYKPEEIVAKLRQVDGKHPVNTTVVASFEP